MLMEESERSRREASLAQDLIAYDLYVTQDVDVEVFVAEARKAQEKVLELMCGTGRVSLPLVEEAGVELTCVDASAAMLARLEEKLR